MTWRRRAVCPGCGMMVEPHHQWSEWKGKLYHTQHLPMEAANR